MSSDDFGTVNVNRAQRAREIEVMRAHYRRHREALVSMHEDAPTEGLANAYQSLIRDIDGSLTKLDDLERGVSTPVVPPPPSIPPSIPLKTQPGERPLEQVYDDEPTHLGHGGRKAGASGGRLVAIVLAGLLVLAAIGWLVWRGSSDRATDDPVLSTADTTDTAPVTEPTTTTVAEAAGLSVAPASHDYGTIRKGTRATRQYEIQNNSDSPITVTVSRSACRCLYYEYTALIPPKAKESLTVTIDGAKARSGALNETIQVAAKNDAGTTASFTLNAEIQ
ncbi:MAG TPA: DUF1573 domain-containing protein [Thermoanaerobaculia bacterium]|jgi:hypothetical protein